LEDDLMRWIAALALTAVLGVATPHVADAAELAPVTISLNDQGATKILNSILNDKQYWSDAWTKTYSKHLYDEIRLKSEPSGYVPMITGEGDVDFSHNVVSDVVFTKNTMLPDHMSGAKVIINLGSGTTPEGIQYRDTLYVLDLTLFYAKFPQRMYRKHDAENNQTVLYFENITPDMVSADTWKRYQDKINHQVENMDKRWAFNKMVDVDRIFGMFVVHPGETRDIRVTFVSSLSFGEKAGWIAKMGSQMPSVIRSGLSSGFNACVDIAKMEQAKR
jgi:hypothetical protein